MTELSGTKSIFGACCSTSAGTRRRPAYRQTNGDGGSILNGFRAVGDLKMPGSNRRRLGPSSRPTAAPLCLGRDNGPILRPEIASQIRERLSTALEEMDALSALLEGEEVEV